MSGLFGSTILEVALGLVFVYLLLSLICSSINELLAAFLKLRARDLERGLTNLLCDRELAALVLGHPLIKAMGSTRAETAAVQFAAGGDLGGRGSPVARVLRPVQQAWSVISGRKDFAGKPSYIPSRTFADALLDALDPERPGTITMDVVAQKARALAAGTAPATAQVKAHVLGLLSPGIEVASQISAATTLADLRAAVAADARPQVAELKRSTLASLDALAREKQAIGQALSGLLDVNRDPRKVLLGIDELKEMVDHLGDAEANQQVRAAIDGAETFDAIRRKVALLPEGDARTRVLEAIDQGQASLEDFRQGVEGWFDDAMDRVSGVYRRRVRWWLVVIAGVVTLAIGADTLQIYDSLSTNPTVRAALVAQVENARAAGGVVENPPASAPVVDAEGTPTAAAAAADTDRPDVSAILDELDKTDLGLGYGDRPTLDGWDSDWGAVAGWTAGKAAGLLLTTFAVALGAPFWFDVLLKVSNVRAAGPRPSRAAAKGGGT